MTRGHWSMTETTWGMFCDNDGCSTRVGPRPSQNDLPLREFSKAGWFIAKTWGDRCPECVANSDVPNVAKWTGGAA